jgi:hypothetical protein
LHSEEEDGENETVCEAVADGVLVRVLPKLGDAEKVRDVVNVDDVVNVGDAVKVDVAVGELVGDGDDDDTSSSSHMYRQLPLAGTSANRFENC